MNVLMYEICIMLRDDHGRYSNCAHTPDDMHQNGTQIVQIIYCNACWN